MATKKKLQKKKLTKKQIKEIVERLIAAVQQECYWDDRDIEVWDEINSGKIDWSGEKNNGS